MTVAVLLTLAFVVCAAAFLWGLLGSWGPDASPVASMLLMGGFAAWMVWASALMLWVLWRPALAIFGA
jgi:hypothetical protein